MGNPVGFQGEDADRIQEILQQQGLQGKDRGPLFYLLVLPAFICQENNGKGIQLPRPRRTVLPGAAILY